MSEIKARQIYKDYINQQVETKVLKGIDVNIEQGEFCAIIGPSGSGKSTLLYVLSGLEQPTSGEVELFGLNIKAFSEKEIQKLRRKDLGFVFQFYNLIPNLTVYENVILPMIIDKSANDESVDEVLKTVGMLDFKNYYPNQLSGGMQQKVAIARALINKPKLIFADEPTGNLDNASGNEIMRLLKSLNEEQGITVVLVTHNLDHVKYCKRVLRLKDGKIENDEAVKV